MIVAVVVAGVLTALAPAAVIPLLRRVGAVDAPNHRSLHSRTALRGVGLAPLVGVIAGFGVLLLLDPSLPVAVIAVSALMAAILGFVEDVRGLPVRLRAGAQLVIGAAAGTAFAIAGSGPWGWVVVATVLVAWYINVANFMDGVDGISGLHGVVVGGAFAALGFFAGPVWLTWTGLVLAAAFGAFLPWNLARRGTFLGDVGSYLLGAIVATTALAAIANGIPWLCVVAPTAIYLADTGVTLLRRMGRGEKWTAPHKQHTYQRLIVDGGLSHVVSALVVALASVATSAIGFLALDGSLAAVLAALAGIMVVVVLYLSLPRLLRRTSHVEIEAEPYVEHRTAPLARADERRWGMLGSRGFVGSGIVRLLNERGAAVVPLDAPRLAIDPEATVEQIVATAVAHPEREPLAMAMRGVDVAVVAAGLAMPDSRATPELFGANALLPALVVAAARDAGVKRVVHLSSAAVQGRRPTLDETSETAPFSAYSRSKALGEAAIAASAGDLDVVIVRATSVQGPDRATTVSLRRLARSPLASVAGRGEDPTVVSSIDALAEFVVAVGTSLEPVPDIVLQPWEGLTTRDVLVAAGGREPIRIPRPVARTLVWLGNVAAAVGVPIAGAVRRVELMWFGQAQDAKWARFAGLRIPSRAAEVLKGNAE